MIIVQEIEQCDYANFFKGFKSTKSSIKVGRSESGSYL
jgi:hypothetical protein